MRTACVVIALAALGLACDIRCQWREFKSKYGKEYTVSEDAARFVVFQQNVDAVQRMNRLGHAKFAINRFSDLTPDEFSVLHSGAVRPTPRVGNLSESDRLRRADIPDSYFAPSVTPVRSQGHCGSCWSFASMGVLEAAYKIATDQTMQFSTQQLVDCAETDLGQGTGCQGGNYDEAFGYLSQHRAMLESAYPYTARNGHCREQSNGVVRVVSFNAVGWDDESQIMSAVMRYGPLGVTLSGAQMMSHYSAGVLSTGDGTCQDNVNHAVVLVGWTTVDGIPAWIIKNSWGNWWGVQPAGWAGEGDSATSKGFMYVKRGSEGCGIMEDPAVFLQQLDFSGVPSGSGSASPMPASSSHGSGQCVPMDAQNACPADAQCGTASDGCGGVVACGMCSDGYTCQNNQCAAAQQSNSCTPNAYVCDGVPCGVYDDGCGNQVQCGCSSGSSQPDWRRRASKKQTARA
eukprot:m51a1_g162 hypothetical protein (459) ;mRNA; r:522727-524441